MPTQTYTNAINLSQTPGSVLVAIGWAKQENMMKYAIQHIGYGLVTDGGEVVTFTSEGEAIDYLRNCGELVWLGADWEIVPYDPPKPAQHAHAYDSEELIEFTKTYSEELATTRKQASFRIVRGV